MTTRNFDITRLEQFVTVTERGCWEWNRYRMDSGYGQVRKNGKTYLIHREVARLHHGEPLPEQEVLHSCDNPPCVNPKHLSWGTRLDNVRDMWAKGRAKPDTGSGDTHHRAKLTEANVLDIRKRREEGVLLKVLAAEYGMSVSAISSAATGRHWRILND